MKTEWRGTIKIEIGDDGLILDCKGFQCFIMGNPKKPYCLVCEYEDRCFVIGKIKLLKSLKPRNFIFR